MAVDDTMVFRPVGFGHWRSESATCRGAESDAENRAQSGTPKAIALANLV
jgi:hypothetical protein